MSDLKPSQHRSVLGGGQLRQLGHLGQPINMWETRLGDVGGDAKKGVNVDIIGMGRTRD